VPRINRKGVKIIKTLIYIEEEAHNQLRHIAVDERVSMSELVRQAVDEFLKKYRARKKGGDKR